MPGPVGGDTNGEGAHSDEAVSLGPPKPSRSTLLAPFRVVRVLPVSRTDLKELWTAFGEK